jgi:hypothetical protein
MPSEAVSNFQDNMEAVHRLVEIHTELTGEGRGRRPTGVEVLNKSAVVLTTAAWEAFVEDLAEEGFNFLLDEANQHDDIPSKVRAVAVENILEDEQDRRKLWALADEGWRDVLRKHKEECIDEYAGDLNTPRHEQVDELFESLIGVRKVSQYWYWRGQSAESSRNRLSDYITRRGQIAHRVSTEDTVRKNYVEQYINFVYRIAVKTANRTKNFIEEQIDSYPWSRTQYKDISQ